MNTNLECNMFLLLNVTHWGLLRFNKYYANTPLCLIWSFVSTLVTFPSSHPSFPKTHLHCSEIDMIRLLFFFFNCTNLMKRTKTCWFIHALQSCGWTLQSDRESGYASLTVLFVSSSIASRCQAAECTSGPSSLSSRASPELCCEGSHLAGTICRKENNQKRRKLKEN